MSNVGKVFVDLSTDSYPRYAVGRTGFVILDTGDFVKYDSAFPGPEFFDNGAFIQCRVDW
jgi:hypothetical protein